MLVEQVGQLCETVASSLAAADVLLVCTGAGFSADSGLAVYRDIANIKTYRELGLTYSDICRPDWLYGDLFSILSISTNCVGALKQKNSKSG